jgi:hypothetical protein
MMQRKVIAAPHAGLMASLWRVGQDDENYRSGEVDVSRCQTLPDRTTAPDTLIFKRLFNRRFNNNDGEHTLDTLHR